MNNTTLVIIILLIIVLGIICYRKYNNRENFNNYYSYSGMNNAAGYDPATRSYYNYLYAEQLARELQE